MLDKDELLLTPAVFSYLDVNGNCQELKLKANSLAYTICQTPIILDTAMRAGITVNFADGTFEHREGNILDDVISCHIFLRDGVVRHLVVSFPSEG